MKIVYILESESVLIKVLYSEGYKLTDRFEHHLGGEAIYLFVKQEVLNGVVSPELGSDTLSS